MPYNLAVQNTFVEQAIFFNVTNLKTMFNLHQSDLLWHLDTSSHVDL